MKFRMNDNAGAPSDQEIDRDVAELRRLLDGVESPREPHPAYWQNFLVHVRERIDEDRFRRRWKIPSIAFASATAVAIVAVVLVNGGIGGREDGPVASGDRPGSTVVVDGRSSGSPIADHLLASNADPLFDQEDTHRLVLDESDVGMLDAIMSDSDAAIFQAIVDEER